MADSFEFRFHDWLEQRLPKLPMGIGIGDDCAILDLGGKQIAVTTDLICSGTHFRADELPERIGRKALAVSLSDIAAMGAIPQHAVVQLALPADWTEPMTQALLNGLLELAEAEGVALVGGDTNRWPGELVIGTTVMGPCVGQPWKLGGARPGDRLIVSGPLGGSLLGHHLDFSPRCDVVRALGDSDLVFAATDISDSLTIDLQSICERSHCGCILRVEMIPVSEAAFTQSEASGRSPLDHAMFDGEDFELLLVTRDESALMARAQDAGLVFSSIGTFTEQPGIYLEDHQGNRQRITPRGYEH